MARGFHSDDEGHDPFSYHCDVKCIGETDRALQILDDEGESFWIPKSVVHEDSEVFEEDDVGTLVVKKWFAEREGWG